MSFESTDVREYLEYMNGRTYACMFLCSQMLVNRELSPQEFLGILRVKCNQVALEDDKAQRGSSFCQGVQSLLPHVEEMVASIAQSHLLLSHESDVVQ